MNDNRLQEKNNEEPMRKYGAQITVARKSVRKLIISVPTCFDGASMCIRIAILKWSPEEIPDTGYFIGDLCRN